MPGALFFPGDEELGKRNDDHKPRDKSALLGGLPAWRKSPRVRRRRLIIAIAAIVALYVFYKGATFSPSIPSNDADVEYGGGIFSPPAVPAGPPPREKRPPAPEDVAASEHYFSGTIKFVKLPSSLRALSNTMGLRYANRNVLFAAANLKSAAAMIPMACEMARWNRNHVHFVLQGREDLPISAIQEINGVGPECNVFWHDARPDYARYSSDLRLKVAITAAMDHIEMYMHPQAIIVDGSAQEEGIFKEAIHEKGRELGKTMIDLNGNAVEKMMWMTRLDSGSLKAWNNVDLDILIHVSPDSLGNLKRLLRSLSSADYFSSPLPRLTIELPSIVDTPTRQFLEEYRWPAPIGGAEHQTSQLTIRHRIPHHIISSEEAATRFFESFYPSNPSGSHVLILSPQTQLSPLYFHYLKYTLLEYRHAAYRSEDAEDIFGIALDLPSYHLNGTTTFTPPEGDPEISMRSTISKDADRTGAFLWQAPSSNAALYFGSSWTALHDFLRNRFEAQHKRKADSSPRLVSSAQPPWMNHLLEFMRLRGNFLLYPSYSIANAFATVHNELGPPEEEFVDSLPKRAEEGEGLEERAFAADPSTYLSSSHRPEKPLTTRKSLLSLLPQDGDLPEVEKLPALTFDGHPTSLSSDDAEAYAAIFRKEVGGCGDRKSKRRTPGSVADLFCSEDEVEDEDEDQENENEGAATDNKDWQSGGETGREEEVEDPDKRRAKAEKGEGVMTWLERLNQVPLSGSGTAPVLVASASASASAPASSASSPSSSSQPADRSESAEAPNSTKSPAAVSSQRQATEPPQEVRTLS